MIPWRFDVENAPEDDRFLAFFEIGGGLTSVDLVRKVAILVLEEVIP